VRLTPHIAWSGGDAADMTLRKFLGKLERHLQGQPLLDRVDPQLGY